MTDEGAYSNERIAESMMRNGIFLNEKVPTPTVAQAVVLIGEAMLYNCLEEFRELVKEVFSGRQLSDLLASDETMRSYLGEDWKPKGLYQRNSHPAALQEPTDPIRKQIVFALQDDNELMQAALGGDLDAENKQMNRELIKKHERILAKLYTGELLSQEDLQLVRDANEIHLNDAENLNGRHKEAIALEKWLDGMIEPSREVAGEDGD